MGWDSTGWHSMTWDRMGWDGMDYSIRWKKVGQSTVRFRKKTGGQGRRQEQR